MTEPETNRRNTMKAVFISYNQALTDRVHAILDEQGIRGFTKWALTQGRGSVDGEPHYGTHASLRSSRTRRSRR